MVLLVWTGSVILGCSCTSLTSSWSGWGWLLQGVPLPCLGVGWLLRVTLGLTGHAIIQQTSLSLLASHGSGSDPGVTGKAQEAFPSWGWKVNSAAFSGPKQVTRPAMQTGGETASFPCLSAAKWHYPYRVVGRRDCEKVYLYFFLIFIIWLWLVFLAAQGMFIARCWILVQPGGPWVVACGIQFPSRDTSLALRVWNLNHWTTRGVPCITIFKPLTLCPR